MSKLNQYQEIIDLIDDNDSFLLTSHVSPDGDNIGSLLALHFLLTALDKETTIVLDDSVPEFLTFLPDNEKIISYTPDLNLDYDLAFVLDSSDLDRIGDVAKLIADRPVANIDHHVDNDRFGDYNLVETAAATAEIIYRLFDNLAKVELELNFAMAVATALITDTGSFKYSSTTAETHQIMAELISVGVDTTAISQEIYFSNSQTGLLLIANALASLKVDPLGVAWIRVTQQDLEELDATLEETEGLVSYPLSLKGIEVAALFKERKSGEIKVSLRSKKTIEVNKIAHQFGGGGHNRAAGLSIVGDISEVEDKVVQAIKDEIKDQKSSC